MDTEKSQTQDFEVRMGQATVVQKPLKEPPEELPREPPSESKIQSLVSRLFGGKGSDTEIGGGEEEEEEKSDTLAEYPVHVRSPAGSATGVFVLPFSADQIEQALQNFREGIPFGRYRSRRTRGRIQDKLSPEGFGSSLFRALFRDEVLALYRESLSIAGKPGMANRMPVKLDIAARELARLPWELLYDPERVEFLSFGKDTPVIRFIDTEPRPYTFDPPLRVLLVSANPSDRALLDLERERIVIGEALDSLKREGKIRIDHLFGATIPELRSKIRGHEPHVIHFMGHGQVNRLSLEDREGRSSSLAESSLGIILRNASSLRMVVLNACETARPADSEERLGLARGLARRGVSAIVAMQFEISDEAACEFAGELYRVLAGGLGVDEAVLWGRIAVQNRFVDDIEWATPVLYMQAREGQIFDDLLRGPKAEVQVDELSAMRKKRIEVLLEQLRIRERNLWRLETQKAKFGRLVPIHIEAGIDEEQMAIQQIWEELSQLGVDKEATELQEGSAIKILDTHKEDVAVDVKRRLADLAVTEERKPLDPRVLEQVRVYYEQGLRHFDTGGWAQALTFLEDVQRLAPGYKDAQALARTASEQLAKQERERRTHDKLAALYRQALTYCDEERWQAAVGLFDEILDIDPNYRDVKIRREEAREAHTQQLAEERIRLQLEALHQAAQMCLETEDWEGAIGLLEEIVQIDRAYADALNQLAAAQRQKELAEFYEEGEEAFVAQDWEQAIANFGVVSAADKSYKDVKAKLEQARQQQQWDALYQEGLEYLEAERWNEAVEALKRVQPDPKRRKDVEVALLYAEGRRYALQKELEASITSFERAMAIQPHYRDVSERLLEVQHRLLQNLYITGEQALAARQWSQAIKSFEQVAERDDGYRNVQAKLHEARQGYRWMETYRKGLEHIEACQWDEAITAFHSILDEGGFQEVHMARLYAAGMKHFESERWDEALASFKAILREVSSGQVLVDSFQQPFEKLVCVFQEMQSFRIASSKANQATALLRADDALNSVQDLIAGGFEDTDLVGMLLGTITEQWTSLIDEERDRVSEKNLRKPFDNPYVAGPPVDHPLFVGREEHFRRIEELWSIKAEGLPSIIVYGHRRMGKSSILRNLRGHVPADTILAYFDMQRVGLVQKTGELLFNVALSIHDALSPPALPEPTLSDFQPMWSTSFRLYLRKLEKCLNKQRVILAIDEFELIEEGIRGGYIDKRLLSYLRGNIQGLPWLTLVFAGLHTLEEMSQDYWHPFFGSVEMIKVSYLSEASARELITNPTEGFAIDYDQDAIETIIRLTNGQPYLVQQICRDLVSHLNHLIFDEEQEREPRITLDDVEVVIGGDFFQRGHYYFIGVWNQAREDERHLLKVLSANSVNELGGLGAAELAEATGMARTSVKDALQRLEQHDVLESETGEDGVKRWRFRVELMRRWVQQWQTA